MSAETPDQGPPYVWWSPTRGMGRGGPNGVPADAVRLVPALDPDRTAAVIEGVLRRVRHVDTKRPSHEFVLDAGAPGQTDSYAAPDLARLIASELAQGVGEEREK